MTQPVGFAYDDFLNHKFDAPRWIVEDIMPAGARPGVIFGKRGAGKSFLTNNLIRSVADGIPFLDTYSTPQAKVAYLSVDMPMSIVQDRHLVLEKMIKNHSNVFISACDTTIDIMRAKRSNTWVQEILRFEPSLVILDTLRNVHRLDENKNESAAAVYRQLIDLFGGDIISKCLIHHEHKTNFEGTGGRPEEELSSGAGAWMDMGNFGIRVKYNKKSKNRTITFPRVRAIDDPLPIVTRLNMRTSLLEVHRTAQSHAQMCISQNPNITKKELTQILVDEGLCSQATAYRIFDRIKTEDGG